MSRTMLNPDMELLIQTTKPPQVGQPASTV
jgi:hypothetical protein